MSSPAVAEVPKPYVVEAILYLARQGKSDLEIRNVVRRRLETIRQVCADHSVRLRREEKAVVAVLPPPEPEHPYVEMGRGVGRLEHARAIRAAEGRLRPYHGRELLDDRYAMPAAILTEANRVLKTLDLPQIGVKGCEA